MTHPLYHSQMSQENLGGDFDQHLAVHNWIDGTKVHFADARHRALRHVKEKIYKKFTGLDRDIACFHIMGDCDGRLPTRDEWASHITIKEWMHSKKKPNEILQYLCEKYGGQPEDYKKIVEFFTFEDVRHGYERLHSLGIFDAESELGLKIFLSNGNWVPTRYIAEAIVRNTMRFPGGIPSVDDWLRCMKRAKWMNKPYSVE